MDTLKNLAFDLCRTRDYVKCLNSFLDPVIPEYVKRLAKVYNMPERELIGWVRKFELEEIKRKEERLQKMWNTIKFLVLMGLVSFLIFGGFYWAVHQLSAAWSVTISGMPY
jgi:hypothetical protein